MSAQWRKIYAEPDDAVIRARPDHARLVRNVLEEKRCDVDRKIQEEGPMTLWVDLRDAIDAFIHGINEEVEIDEKPVRGFVPVEDKTSPLVGFNRPTQARNENEDAGEQSKVGRDHELAHETPRPAGNPATDLERAGPHVAILERGEFLSCLGCRFLKAHLRQSGENPDWEYNCMHPDGDPHTGGFIGYDSDASTPEWCPLRKENLHGGSHRPTDGSFSKEGE